MATIRTTIDESAATLTITVEGFPPIVIDPAADYPAELNTYAALHGFKQRYVDKAALGAGATAADKHAAILALVTYHREGGVWNMKPGTGDGATGGLLARALVIVTGAPIETVRETLAGLDKKAQASLRAQPAIATAIATLRKAPKVDDASASAAAFALTRLSAQAAA